MVQSLLCKFNDGQVLDSIVPKINKRGATKSSISSEKVPILSCLTIVVPTKVKSWGNRGGAASLISNWQDRTLGNLLKELKWKSYQKSQGCCHKSGSIAQRKFTLVI